MGTAARVLTAVHAAAACYAAPMLIPRIMHALIGHLVDQRRLELAPDATVDQVADWCLAALDEQKAFAQLGPWLAQTLIECPLVDELYADDREISEAVSDL